MNELEKDKNEIMSFLDEGKQVLAILRGVSGCGKSTFARELITNHTTFSSSTVISADYYFLRPDGVYDWNPKFLANAHKWCFTEAENSMVKTQWGGSFDLVVLDNTNIARSQFKKYIDLAQSNGYIIKEIIVGSFDEESLKLYAKRNSHGVSLEAIKRMASKFEE